MAITVDDIQKKQFSTRSRGYDKFEVDTFLEDIMMQMEQTETELDELRSKRSSLYETINVYKQTEDSMKEVLLIAKERRTTLSIRQMRRLKRSLLTQRQRLTKC